MIAALTLTFLARSTILQVGEIPHYLHKVTEKNFSYQTKSYYHAKVKYFESDKLAKTEAEHILKRLAGFSEKTSLAGFREWLEDALVAKESGIPGQYNWDISRRLKSFLLAREDLVRKLSRQDVLGLLMVDADYMKTIIPVNFEPLKKFFRERTVSDFAALDISVGFLKFVRSTRYQDKWFDERTEWALATLDRIQPNGIITAYNRAYRTTGLGISKKKPELVDKAVVILKNLASSCPLPETKADANRAIAEILEQKGLLVKKMKKG